MSWSRSIRSAGGAGSRRFLQFEQAYAAHIGVKHAIAVTSGTTALYTAMAALEIGPGDEVIIPAWTWYADYDAIVRSGACRSSPRSTSRSASIPRHRAEDHAADQGRHTLPPPGMPGRHGRNPRNRPQAQAPRGGGLRRVRGRALQGEIRRHDWRHRHQQLPAQQDHHLGRGRAPWSPTMRSSSSGPSASTTSARSARPTPSRSRAGCWRPSPPATSA